MKERYNEERFIQERLSHELHEDKLFKKIIELEIKNNKLIEGLNNLKKDLSNYGDSATVNPHIYLSKVNNIIEELQ